MRARGSLEESQSARVPGTSVRERTVTTGDILVVFCYHQPTSYQLEKLKTNIAR